MNILRRFLFSFFLVFSTFIFAQTAITAKVVGENGEAIGGANVLLKNSENTTVAFSSTSTDGSFTLKAEPGTYQIRITYLGFRTESQEITVALENLHLKTITIHEDSSELEEVFLKAEAKIVQRGDTTIFNTVKFLNGTEQTLNDVLQTLPGVGVNDKGKVTVGGKAVDRLLIDGEDLYKNQHQFATENISSKIVGNIELIRNYTDFETLKTENKTGLTALNVNIKDEFKNKLTGSFEAGAGIENKYKIKPSLFNFGKKNKSSLITNFNNTGDSPLSIQDYLEITNPVDIEKGSSIVNFSKTENMPQFLISEDKAKSRVTNFATLSSIFNPNKRWKIDFYGIINHSKQERLLSKEQMLSTNTAPINIFEENRITEKNLFGIAHFKSIYKRNENSVFVLNSNLDIDLSTLNTNIDNLTDQNTGSIVEKFEPKKLISKTNVSYSEKFKNAIFTTMAFFNYDSDKDNLNISSNQSFLNLDFEENNFQLSQRFRKEQTFSGLDLKYSFSKSKIGFSLRSNTSLTNEKLYSSANNSLLLENHLKLNTLKSISAADFTYRFNPIYSFGLGLSYNYNLRKFNAETSEVRFVDFKSNFKAAFSKNNIGELSYSYSHKTPTIENLIQNAIVIDHRNIVMDEDISFNSYFPFHEFNYQHFVFDQKKKFSLIFNVSLRRYERSINNNLINNENLSITKYKLVDLDKSTSFLVFFEKQFSFLPIAISNSTSFDISESAYFQDDILTSFKSQSFGGFVELNSKFKTSPIHFKLGYKYTFERYASKSITSNARREQPYLNLRGNISTNLYWELNNSYKLYTVESNRRGIFYLDPSLRYSKKNSNWEYSLSGTNILNLNTKTIIESQSFPGITEEQTTAILRGYILLGAKYKF